MTIPSRMRAFILTGHGGLDKLEFHDNWPTPEPKAGEVLIEVGACGCNNTDINTRTGWYSKGVTQGTTVQGGKSGFDTAGNSDGGWGGNLTFPRIQGADVCGRVVALGEGAPQYLLDRRVLIDTWLRDWNEPLNMDKCRYFGSEVNGGYAQYTVAPVKSVHPIESVLSDVELASFATSYITAENMLHRANVSDGDVVLIPGASGGVGSALIQLANRRGARTIAMSSPTKTDAVREIGASAVLPREPTNLKQELEEQADCVDVDVVADVVGGPLWPQMIDVLTRGGRYTCAGAIAGPIVEFDLRTFYLRDMTFTGATIIPPGMFANLVGYIERGEIKPLVAASYPLEDLKDAQEEFLAKRHVGNIVIEVRQPPA